ncbi:MAG: VCBS repeat-containing protein, partial [Planctomycetes bacterium]|nr:VCBS repeat-containing protein [Planctomycetota bacterium]
WLHAARPKNPRQVDSVGVMLKLKTGDPIHVGPQPGSKVSDFDILQGSRTTFALSDFDEDGLLDIVVGDTYGVARYYRNAGTGTEPLFEFVKEFESLRIRMVPYSADWNRDGRTDIVGSAASGLVVVWLNEGNNHFSKGEPLSFPPVPYSPTVSVVDWNEDGDDDLIIGTAYGFFCWFERSFLESGYAKGEVVLP